MKKLTFLLVVPITLFLGWGLGASYERQQQQSEIDRMNELYSDEMGSGQVVLGNPQEEVDISLFWETWRKLLTYYIEPEDLKVRELVFGAVHGMVEAVGDPYTVFMTPSENQDFLSALNGNLEGIGAELTMRDNAIVVVAPLKDSPAAKAGLLPEDIIISVDGEDITDKRLDQAVTLIRGPEGSRVKLGVLRKEEADILEVEIVRAKVHIPSTASRIIETGTGSVGYIEMNRFDENLTREVQASLNKFIGDDLDGIVLDVRFNGGGLLNGAVDIASFFIGEGKVVTVERRGEQLESQFVTGQPIMPNIPITILINEGSASASEILAGALQDHGRATVVGVKSFGKGTVQEIVDLPGGASMRVTVAKWLTPNGMSISVNGITPDITVERTQEDYANDNDPQLDTAIHTIYHPKVTGQ